MQTSGTLTSRDVTQRIEEIKKIFLDFSVKFNYPEVILPSKEKRPKSAIMMDYRNSFKDLTHTFQGTDLSQIMNLSVFGDITKVELLYFVLYHTQRHIHQLKNILEDLRAKSVRH